MDEAIMKLLGIKDPAVVEVVRDDGSSQMVEIPRKWWGVSDIEVIRGLNRLMNEATAEAILAAPVELAPGCVMPPYDPDAPKWKLQ